MGVRSKRQRRETQEVSRPGARGKVRGSLSATAREAAAEQSKEIVTKVTDWGGQAAGAGLAVLTARTASALGHQASTLALAGAISVGVALGGFTSKVVNRTIDKLNEADRAGDGSGARGGGAGGDGAGGDGAGGGGTGGSSGAGGGGAGGGAGGAAYEVMARLSEVLQALEAVSQAVTEATETIGLAQGRVAQATRGARNELARAANASLRDAPRQLREGQAEVSAGRELVADFLVQVAGGRG